MLNFGNVNTEIPLPNSCCPGMKWVWSAQSEKKKKKNCDKLIAAMSLPKQGKKNCNNCGNGITENGGKKSGSEIQGGVKKKKMLRSQLIYLWFGQNLSCLSVI